ncbi:MAG TPA: VPLPA-CTERM sorting domain-containing protein [Spongiibacteraceae bacterium]|nr:VPLPA-CTERM sorting domain-containing protein [Spongiibacteraceae bacterium]
MKNKILAKSVGAAVITIMAAGSTYATTVDFANSAGNFSSYAEDGYSFSPARLVKGNCLAGACLALNGNETTVMTFAGGAFTLDSLSFALQGKPSVLAIFDTNDSTKSISFSLPASSKGIAYYSVAFGGLFANVTSITLTEKACGNVRIDNIEAVSQVPLPGTGWLLGSGLIGLAGLHRRRKTAQ